jgi:hypothetical protein
MSEAVPRHEEQKHELRDTKTSRKLVVEATDISWLLCLMSRLLGCGIKTGGYLILV